MKTRNIYFTILIACAVFAVSCQVPEKKKQSHRLNVPNVADIAEGKYANKGLKSVTFKNKTVSIGKNAFKGNKITKLELPSSLKTIGKNAFKGNKITKLELPSSLKTIEEGAFENNAIKTLELPSSLKTIGKNAFKGNVLKKVTLNSKKVTHLSAEMFKNKDGSLPTFLLPKKEVMKHVMSMFVTTNTDGTKTIDVTFKSKDEASLSQKAIDDYKKTLTEKEKPSEGAKDSDERADIPRLCTLLFMVGDSEHHKAKTTCGTSIADKDMPSIPKKTHYTFYLWSNTQVALGTPPGGGFPPGDYLTTHKVTKTEETLYASWNPKEYKVLFMYDDAKEHKAVNVAYKKKVDKADVDTPIYDHYTFDKWYKDKTFTQPFNFDADTITGSTTLYAKRTRKQYEVTFIDKRHDYMRRIITELRVDYDSTIPSADAPKPKWEGIGDNTFDTWYKDEKFTQPFNFDADTITGPTTLYGTWKKTYYVVKTYAIYEWNFRYGAGDKEYDSYTSYEDDSYSKNYVVEDSKFPRPTEPEELNSDVRWPIKWFRIQQDESKANFDAQKPWIKTWVLGKDIDELKYKPKTLFIERFPKIDTITKNAYLLGLMRVNYKAKFFVDGKLIGSSPIRYRKQNTIDELLKKSKSKDSKSKINLQKTIPKGFDESNARFDGWYTYSDYHETRKKDGHVYKKHFNKKNKRTSTLDGTSHATMYGRWIKTYKVQYKYKEKTIEKTFKDEKEIIMHINGNKTHVMEPVSAKIDTETKRRLGYKEDEPTTEAPDGYTLTFCWYSDEGLHTPYYFPDLTKPTTKIYGAWKFAEYDGRIGEIDCGVAKDPPKP